MTKCKICGKSLTGRQIMYCCSQCKGKGYRKNNKEKIKQLNKIWREKNKKYNKLRLKIYKSSEKYRLAKKEHDKNYRIKHGNKYNKRNKINQFKKNCRSYAYKKIEKDFCCLCGTKDNLELHHSKGYKSRSIEGVIVVCKLCHLEVIHGRGYRCQI